MAVYTTATRPTASASWRGRMIAVQDANADERVQYCRRKADGSYEWTPVTDDSVYASSQAEEDAAFASGAKMVVRVDLIP